MGKNASNQRTALIVLAAVGVGLVAVCVVGGLFVGLAIVTPDKPKPGVKVWERDELRKAVMGRSQGEVQKLLGTPDSTSDTGPDCSWHYRERTRDKLTGKVDFSVWIYFSGGKVNDIHF